MITYEASLVCDKCKAAIAGELSQRSSSARDSAFKAGRYKGWFIGDGGAALCPGCKHTSVKSPYEIPSKNKT